MITAKQLIEALEAIPEDAEIRWLIDGENPLYESWDIANIIYINDVFGKNGKVILTNDTLKDF